MSVTQKNRLLAITTALGADALLIKRFTVTERLGRLFELEAELVSEKPDVDFDALIGTNATVRFTTPSGASRFFNGYISRFAQTNQNGNFATYRATLVPWFWLLTRTADCRIFQNKKVPAIMEEIFKAHGFKDYKLKLSASYREWEYCVQYRETDFNFLSRLMEQEGIYYHFEHGDGVNTLVLVDSPGGHEVFPGYGTVTYRPRTQERDEHVETVTDWLIEREVQPGVWALADFNFKTPASPIRVDANIGRSHEQAGFEIFDYPGEYVNRAEGDACAKVRIEEAQSQHEILRGQSTVRGLAAGHKFTLKGHFRPDQNRAYLVTSTSLHVATGAYESSGSENGDFFTCSFSAIPATTPFRSARSTPKPIIQGPQTAIVVGKAGEEIDPDEFGRVKVLFHWDRYGKADENSSCWIRVSQTTAGKGWGAINIPRIGQEVVVEFLEGDPDRPLITGRVYNAVSKVPYALPEQKTISTLKTSSSKGSAGFNEIRFEDKKGEEQIFVHGEKNVDIRVKNDIYELAMHDRHLIVKNDQIEKVENDRQEQITRDHLEAIGRDHALKIGGKEAVEITGSRSLKVKDDVIEEFGKNQSTQVTESLYIKAKNIVLEATENITINVGDSYIAIESGGIKIATNGDVVIEAKQNITQKATSDFKVEATANASIKGTAGLKLESPATADLKSSSTTVKGDGMVTIQGGLVNIN